MKFNLQAAGLNKKSRDVIEKSVGDTVPAYAPKKAPEPRRQPPNHLPVRKAKKG